MMYVRSCFQRGPLAALLALALVGIAPAVQAEGPITVTYTTTGDVVPGGTVTVEADVEVGDGSTLQSMSWSQAWGADATLSNTSSDTVTVALGSAMSYKEFLFHVLTEPPLTEDQLPPNVEPPEGEFPGGQQDRFEVVGVDPFSLEEAALVTLELEVVTTSGTYHDEFELHTAIPWKPAVGIRTVPIGNPVLLHGKEQASYDWALDNPPASDAVLMDGTSQYPEFIPDVPGLYKVEVTDLTETAKEGPVVLRIYAGTWHGVIVGQDADGRPVADPSCTGCHSGSPAPDKFTPWAQTGHAEIFKDMMNTNTHYSTSCLGCHTVGFDPLVEAGGIDEADDYLDFLMEIGDLESADAYDPTETYHFHADLENWNTTLDQFPETARLGNIQCENCHGPQDAAAHSNGAPRITLASKMCAVCHGEPPRHGRYQQWQLSKHADYELAIEEGTSSNCSRCHSANGFIQWVEELGGDSEAEVDVTWTEDEVHPQTCQACHDPHDIGTASGDANNATVRVMGDTPETVGGYEATDVGKGAVCIMCHNGRRGLRNDQNYLRSDGTRATHPGPQGDVLMGENAYFVQVGQRSYHADVENACVACHMQATPPPDFISYNRSGTNHTFFASNEICSECHAVIQAEDVQGPVEEGLEELLHMLEQGVLNLIESQLALDRTIDLDGDGMITDSADIMDIEFTDYRGRQALIVDLAGVGPVGPVQLGSIDVITGGDAIGFDDLMDDRVLKSGWNYFLLHADGSHGVHNPSFARAVLEASVHAMQMVPPSNGGVAGMVGEGEIGAGAVGCMTPFVYWAEIAAHNEGANGSTWRTDLVARNTVTSPADVEFILHTSSGEVTSDGAVGGGAQAVFEDIVGTMGIDGKGALEICSDQPLQVIARIFNQPAGKTAGTFGQFLDGHVGGVGMASGESARLLGMRQQDGAYRSNISITNTGLEPAEVRITLYDNGGSEMTSYTVEAGIGMVVQDLQPFKTRAGAPNVGWGFALVEVTEGYGVLTSASVVDAVTGDATTIPMKQ